MCEVCSWGDVTHKSDPLVLDDGTKVFNIPDYMDAKDVSEALTRFQDEILEEPDPTGTKRLVAEFERKLAAQFRELIRRAASYVEDADEIAFQRITINDIENVLSALNAELITGFSPEVRRYIGLAAASGVIRGNAQLLNIGVEPPGGAEEFPDWGNHPVDQSVVDAMNGSIGVSITKLSQDTISDIVSIVQDGIRNNQNPNVTARQIRDRTNLTLNRARTIARTESINTTNQAAEARYKAYGIEEFEIIVAGDERTCIVCQLEAAGGPYKFSEGGHRPTFHPNCRCFMKPIRPR